MVRAGLRSAPELTRRRDEAGFARGRFRLGDSRHRLARPLSPSRIRHHRVGVRRSRRGYSSRPRRHIVPVVGQCCDHMRLPALLYCPAVDRRRSGGLLCHRASRIEETGAKESVLHLLMLVEVGIPVLASIFLEITSPLFALMITSFLLHEATALWDVAYAVTRREVSPIEQHVHSFLDLIPLMAISFCDPALAPVSRAVWLGQRAQGFSFDSKATAAP
jgi:hypothetical protein